MRSADARHRAGARPEQQVADQSLAQQAADLQRRRYRRRRRKARDDAAEGRLLAGVAVSMGPSADAKPVVGRRGRADGRALCRAGIGRDLALRVYTSRLLGGDPRLVLHGGGNTSVKTVRPTSLGDAGRGAVRQGQRLGHGGDSSRPGCRRCGSRRCAGCARATRSSDEDMVRVQRANLIDPGRAEPVGRDAAARLPAAQIHRPHARDRGAEPRRPARRRRALRRSLRRRGSASCPTSCRASCSPRRRPKSSRKIRRSRASSCSSTASSALATPRATPTSG